MPCAILARRCTATPRWSAWPCWRATPGSRTAWRSTRAGGAARARRHHGPVLSGTHGLLQPFSVLAACSMSAAMRRARRAPSRAPPLRAAPSRGGGRRARRWLLSGGADGLAAAWDLDAMACPRTLTALDQAVTALSVSADGGHVAYGGAQEFVPIDALEPGAPPPSQGLFLRFLGRYRTSACPHRRSCCSGMGVAGTLEPARLAFWWTCASSGRVQSAGRAAFAAPLACHAAACPVRVPLAPHSRERAAHSLGRPPAMLLITLRTDKQRVWEAAVQAPNQAGADTPWSAPGAAADDRSGARRRPDAPAAGQAGGRAVPGLEPGAPRAGADGRGGARAARPGLARQRHSVHPRVPACVGALAPVPVPCSRPAQLPVPRSVSLYITLSLGQVLCAVRLSAYIDSTRALLAGLERPATTGCHGQAVHEGP